MTYRTAYMDLLLQEHSQLQAKLVDLQRRYDILETSMSENDDTDAKSKSSFVKRLLNIVKDLFRNDLYSDITVHCIGHQLRAHRFVIAARTDYWGDLSSVDRIDFNDMTYSVGCTLLKWMYTDELDPHLSDSFLSELIFAAIKFRLDDLRSRCEMILFNRIDISNCLMLYELSEKLESDQLYNKCVSFIASQWDNFNAENFSGMSASLLHRLLSVCEHSLHTIIRLKRMDVLFLYFIDHDADLSQCVNVKDENGIIPLQLAFDLNEMSIATLLVSHKADVNALNNDGKSLLMVSAEKGNVETCDFLINSGADSNMVVDSTGDTLFHILARNCSKQMIEWLSNKNLDINVNAVNKRSETALKCAIENSNDDFVNFLLGFSNIDANICDESDVSPIFAELLKKNDLHIAERLIAAGATVDCQSADGETLLCSLVKEKNLGALQFLCRNNVNLDKRNFSGVTALHLAVLSKPFNADMLKILLLAEANPLVERSTDGATVLHLSLENESPVSILNAICETLGKKSTSFSSLLSMRDKSDRTVLAKALYSENLSVVEYLVKIGADVNEKLPDGESLLLKVLKRGSDSMAIFMLNNGADFGCGTREGKSLLHVAVELRLPESVRFMCINGANLDYRDPKSDLPPLWTAIENEYFDVAKLLILYGCDLNARIKEDGQRSQALLHRAIDRNLINAAIFLIESGCDIDVLVEAEGMCNLMSPLHLCIVRKLDDIALCLIKNHVRLHLQDAEGRTAIHLAVSEASESILNSLLAVCDPSVLLIHNRQNLSALALAVFKNDLATARSIIEKAPQALTQVNHNGENLLHTAVRKSNLECVFLLLSLGIDVQMYTEDTSRVTALHICAQTSNETIFRNLILAGANVNAKSANGYTPLHVAAYNNNETICMILLENGALPNVMDLDGNNPLHAAVTQGSVSAVNVLLGESRLDSAGINRKQETPLLLASSEMAVSNSLDILHMFMNVHPDYPVDNRDMNGNTLFLRAYMNGTSELCKALLKYGVCFAVSNYNGISVFNYDTPTKQLLFMLLDNLESEPKWAEGDFCSECAVKFSITMRKHHCRHCGRLVCGKCSEYTIPILKYNIQKAVRVCQICSDILTIGVKK